MEEGTPRASKLYALKLLSFHEPLHKKVRPASNKTVTGTGDNAERCGTRLMCMLPLNHFRREVDILFGYLSSKVCSFPYYHALDNTV